MKEQKTPEQLKNDYATLCARIGDIEVTVDTLYKMKDKVIVEANNLKTQILKLEDETKEVPQQ